jgi:hypothetical protein
MMAKYKVEYILVGLFSESDWKMMPSKDAKVDLPEEEGPEMAMTKICLPFWRSEVASDIVKSSFR